MIMDETLFGIAEKIANFAVIYLVDITETPDFNDMYELYDPCTVMFFYRNKHIMIDLGTGNNNKINWAIENKQELIDIVETVYRGASKGNTLYLLFGEKILNMRKVLKLAAQIHLSKISGFQLQRWRLNFGFCNFIFLLLNTFLSFEYG